MSKTERHPSRGIAIVVVTAFSWAVHTASAADDYPRRYALTGAIGLRGDDYSYSSGEVETTRQTLRKQLDLGFSGHIWDPRFLMFDSRVMLMEENVSANDGDRDLTNVGYFLNTTWFSGRGNPLTLNAGKSRNTVTDYTGPSYDLDTQTYGARWGWNSKLLGTLRFSYDRLEAQSASPTIARDEQNDVIGIEGHRRFEPSGKGKKKQDAATTDLTYGYRYNNTEDQVLGTRQRQHYWYASERTQFSEKTSLSTNLTYYDRTDGWQNPDAVSPVDAWQQPLNATAAETVLYSKFLLLSSSLTTRRSEQLRHFASVSINRNEVGTSQTDGYTASFGSTYRLNPRWEALGAVRANNSTTTGIVNTERRSQGADVGARYTDTWGNFHVNGGYTLGIENIEVLPESETVGDAVRHTAYAGYSRRHNPLYQDALDYRLSQQTGAIDTMEHNARYSIISDFGLHDTLNTVLEYRDYTTSEEIGVPSSTHARLTMHWTHRFSGPNQMVLSAGYSDYTTQESSYTRAYGQARLTLAPRSVRNLMLSGMVRREQDESDTGRELQRNTAEADATYTVGRWQSKLQYRYRDSLDTVGIEAQESIEMNEQSIMLYVRRNFGMYF